ncbi:MAG: patatin-like phospholipase family protein [Ktedonobacterales bacterium]|nr:patatin-like phospholipase family protein [Ktedonobacterales bacterium]
MLMDLQTWRGRVSAWRTRARQGRKARGGAEKAHATRTAYVLLGGGARGAAQAGAISVLLERGFLPDFIVGISAGSWNGAYIAQDPTPAHALELERLWIETTSQQIIGAHRWAFAFNAVAFRSSLYSGEGLRRVAERYLGERTFEDLRVPLRIVATDLVSGEPRLFSEGPLLPAVLASSAMPGIFPPVVAQDAVLVDGGIVEWAGCLAALASGATRICLVGCGSALPRRDKQESYRHIFERSWEVGNRSNFSRTVFALRGAGVEVLAIHPRIEGASLLNFDRAPALIQAGRVAAEQAIASWSLSTGQASLPLAMAHRGA